MRTWMTARMEGDEMKVTVGGAAPYGRKIPREATVTMGAILEDNVREALVKAMTRALKSVEETITGEAEVHAAAALTVARQNREE